MNNNIKFLQSFKGKTVEEAIAILQKEEQEFNNKQSLLQKQKMEWYKNCIGKYFVIQHNDTAFTLVHIKEREKLNSIDQNNPQFILNNPQSLIAWECYRVVLSDHSIIEANAGFNWLWLCNPYERDTMSSTCKEITKEEFERITSPFNSLINEIKQVLNEIHSI